MTTKQQTEFSIKSTRLETDKKEIKSDYNKYYTDFENKQSYYFKQVRIST